MMTNIIAIRPIISLIPAQSPKSNLGLYSHDSFVYNIDIIRTFNFHFSIKIIFSYFSFIDSLLLIFGILNYNFRNYNY